MLKLKKPKNNTSYKNWIKSNIPIKDHHKKCASFLILMQVFLDPDLSE